MSEEQRIIVTHCVDPNHFYFKYLDDCVNSEYSNFDYEIQCYGNEFHVRKILEIGYMGYSPDKNEIIIFFDLTFNKWLRGRVINDDHDEITLWCIDNGLFRKSDIQFIQPLTETLKRDLNVVHVGGLTVLPAKKKLDFEKLIVKLDVAESWDDDSKDNFKAIVGSSKRLVFIEEMELEKHKFGVLRIESKNGKQVLINEILLEMSSAISCVPFVEDMSSFVSKERLENGLYQSYAEIYTTTTSKRNISKTTSTASVSKSETKANSITERSDIADGMKPPSPLQSQSRNDGEIVANVENSSTETEQGKSVECSQNECFDSFDVSSTAAVPSISSIKYQSMKPQRRDNRGTGETKSVDYECYLSAFGAGKKKILRKPMQTSMDWINRKLCPPNVNAVAENIETLEKPSSMVIQLRHKCTNTDDDDDDTKSCVSSIIALVLSGSSSSSTISF